MNTNTLLKKQDPLYCQIKDILKNQIAQGLIKPREPIPSLNEISQTFGVSMITARQAVGILLNEGLLYVVNGKGTFVADRPLKKITIGLVIGFGIEPYLDDIPLSQTGLIHLKEWMDFLSLESSGSNYIPINIPMSLKNDELTQFIRDNNVSGIVVLGSFPQNSEYILELIAKKSVPYVVLGELIRKKKEGNFIIFDNYAGAVKAAQYIIDKGHRRIGILVGAPFYLGYRQRLQGYRDVLSQNGISAEDIFEIQCEASGVDGGYVAAKKLLSAGKNPTAILCSSDFKALGAVKAIKELGLRIPEDVAIVGYDGLSLSSEDDLPLTTVRVPKVEIVREGLNFLLKATLQEPGNAVIQKEIEPELIIGRTA